MKLSIKVNLIISLTISFIIILIFYILAQRYEKLINDNLLETSRSFYKNIVITRSWIAQHNGVYVEKNENVKSTPYLKNPDVRTVDNRTLTLKNPALVTRELSDLSKKMGGRFQFHITSLKPINPNNSPNSFEKRALKSFESSKRSSKYLEYARIEKINNKKYFRYFGPLYTEASCLNCHGKYGYKEGDIRGGISIILPMDSIEMAKHNNYIFMALSGLLTILTLFLIINYFIRKVIIRPLLKIEDATKAMEQGKYVPLGIKRDDEIGDLANSFKSMQKKIKITTRELQRSEKKYRTLISRSPEAVLILNKKRKIIDANENISKLSNYSIDDILHKPIDAIVTKISLSNHSTEESNKFEAVLNCKDGTTKPVEVYISPEYYETEKETNLSLFYLRDISERKRVEKMMIETEKMYALHQLSSGIAHEIRNPLFGIRSNFNYLKGKLPDNSEFQEVYSDISIGLQRINTLISSILDYAKPHQLEFKPHNIEQIINRVLSLTRRKFEEKKHEIIVEVPDNLPPIEIDRHKIEQVLINLSTNSLEAMEENGRFEISVKKTKEFLEISVSDDGCGIGKDDLPKIFDPFFTRSRHGTGLGLSIVISIIEQHNGTIKVFSKKNERTTFKIKLPLRQQ